jgi:hypothetical protein
LYLLGFSTKLLDTTDLLTIIDTVADDIKLMHRPEMSALGFVHASSWLMQVDQIELIINGQKD